MAARSRNPHVLAYQAVRDADDTDQARRVYAAMNASTCGPVGTCTLDEECPFYVGCLIAEGEPDGR